MLMLHDAVGIVRCDHISCVHLIMIYMQASSKGWDALARVAGLCNRASFKENQQHLKVLDRYAQCTLW